MQHIPIVGSKKIFPEMPSESDNSKMALMEHQQHQFTNSEGNKNSDHSQNSIVFTEELDTEAAQEQEKIAAFKEKERKLEEKRENAHRRKLNRIMCC